MITLTRVGKQEGDLAKEEDKQNNKKMKRKNKSLVDISNKVDAEVFELRNSIQANETSGWNKRSKKLKNDKMRNGNITQARADVVEDGISVKENAESDKLHKERKRRNAEGTNKVDIFHKKDDASELRNGKSKKPGKIKKKSRPVENELSLDNLLESREEDAQDVIYQMSSGDEDYSKGMKKWITQYRQSRPGLKLLQERIDDFIMAHEAREETARVEREAQAAEGGWTVVVHHKGRKKTTEAETGVAVGSVAQAAVMDKMANKKTKEVGIDFYRFQKREAHRNEIMMLQSKFEQDKKRIQHLRAARKFRPY